VCPFCKTSMAMPRLSSEYFAARAQSLGRISATADADVKTSNARIGDAHRLPMSRPKKGKGGSPEPPGTNVTTRIAAIEVKRPYLRALQTGSATPVRRHRRQRLRDAPLADSACATLPHSAIRRESEAQNDPGKIV